MKVMRVLEGTIDNGWCMEPKLVLGQLGGFEEKRQCYIQGMGAIMESPIFGGHEDWERKTALYVSLILSS